MPRFRVGSKLVCNCDKLRGMAPEAAWSESGPLAVAGSDIADRCCLSESAKKMLTGNSQGTVLPSQQQYVGRFVDDVMRFIVDNRLSYATVLGTGVSAMKAQLKAEAEKHWSLHVGYLRAQGMDKASVEDVEELRSTFRGLVIHNEDHKYGRICLYCPQLYGQCIQSTFWGEDDVFEEVDASPTEADRVIRSMLPTAVRRLCSWGIARENIGVDQTVPRISL